LAFRFGDDFVFDYQDVALAEALALLLESVEKKLRQGITRFYLGLYGEGDDVEF
jgi:hypothetical protein